MPFDILENKNDPLRAFTLNTKEYGRIQINGVSLVRPQKFIILIFFYEFSHWWTSKAV